MPSIFDNIVSKENDHTRLLCNVMERNGRAASVILTYLTGQSVDQDDVASLSFHTQSSFNGPDGREIPDIIVEGREFRCIVEVKVDATLRLTPRQEAGYPASFAGCGPSHMCLLVPHGWRHLAPAGIAVRYWEELIAKLEGASEYLADSLLKEVVGFWNFTFKVAKLDQQELEYLTQWSRQKYSAIGKLEKALIQAKRLFEARDFETEGSYTEEIESSFGFSLKRNGKYLLWIGIWTLAPTPLSFGLEIKGSWLRPADAASLLSARQAVGGYYLWPLGPETWDNPELICEHVIAFLNSREWA